VFGYLQCLEFVAALPGPAFKGVVVVVIDSPFVERRPRSSHSADLPLRKGPDEDFVRLVLPIECPARVLLRVLLSDTKSLIFYDAELPDTKG